MIQRDSHTTQVGKIVTIAFRGWLAKFLIKKTAAYDSWKPRYDQNGEVYMWVRERP